MPTTHILTPENRSAILKPSNNLRVGIMAPLDENGQPKLCSRWAKPFTARGAEVVLIPVGTPDIPEVLGQLDGLVMPGGDSNIHPFFYTGLYADFDDQDIARDQYAMQLLRAAYELDLPTLGICRGMQEMVVEFGGALQRLDKTQIDHASGYKARKADGSLCFETADQRIHPFIITKGGKLSAIYNAKALAENGLQDPFLVNSIHHEGITREIWDSPQGRDLRKSFDIEALAPDDVIEGISAKGKSFFVGLQPHFELEGPLHQLLFDTLEHGFMHYIKRHKATRTGQIPEKASLEMAR